MWNRLSKREKILLSGLLGTALIFCFYYYIFNPQLKAFEQVKTELTEQRSKLSQAQNTAASLTKETALLEKAKSAYEEKGKLFTTEMRDGSDIILLGLKSASENIQITEVEPAAIKENEYSLELPLKIGVEGDYRNLLAFCNDLDKLLKGISDLNLAEIRSLKIEQLTAPNQSASQDSFSDQAVASGMVKASVGIIIFSAKDPEGRLQLDSINRWLTGRYNIFRQATITAPVQELEGHLHVPPVNSDTQGGSNTVSPGSSGQSVGAGKTGPVPAGNKGTAVSGGQTQAKPVQQEPEYILRK